MSDSWAGICASLTLGDDCTIAPKNSVAGLSSTGYSPRKLFAVGCDVLVVGLKTLGQGGS